MPTNKVVKENLTSETNKFKPPFRVGRKQSRAVLDSVGREVVVFPKGQEGMAVEYCEFLNSKYTETLITANSPQLKIPKRQSKEVNVSKLKERLSQIPENVNIAADELFEHIDYVYNLGYKDVEQDLSKYKEALRGIVNGLRFYNVERMGINDAINKAKQLLKE